MELHIAINVFILLIGRCHTTSSPLSIHPSSSSHQLWILSTPLVENTVSNHTVPNSTHGKIDMTNLWRVKWYMLIDNPWPIFTRHSNTMFMVRDNPKLLDDGRETPNSQGKGWWFDPPSWNFLFTWQKLAKSSTLSCALALACWPSLSVKKQQQHVLLWTVMCCFDFTRVACT